MNYKLVTRISLLFFLLFSNWNFAQDLFDSTHTAAFANYLQTSKQYKLASEEYERLLFFNPTNELVLSKLFYNERKSGNAQSVKNRFEKKYTSNNNASDEVFMQYLQSLISLNFSDKALAAIQTNSRLTLEQKSTLSAFAFISDYNWTNALNELAKIEPKSVMISKASEVLAKAKDEHYKKPFVAAGLSALVPGLGKVYTGNLKDGIISFVFVGINTFQSFRYFEKKGIKSAGAWIFGSLATGFI